MQNKMQITAEDARAGTAAAKEQPAAMIIRLKFNYGIKDERSQVPLDHVETIALMIGAGRDPKEVDAQMEKALVSVGASWPSASTESRWKTVDLLANNPARAVAIFLDVQKNQADLPSMPSYADAVREIAGLARQAGQDVSDAVGAIGWRLASDVVGATTVMEALGMAFEDLGALNDALELKKELVAATRQAPAQAARPLL